MRGKAAYIPMTGSMGRTELNNLGYDVKGDAPPDMVMVGLMVALAEEIEILREEIKSLKTQQMDSQPRS